MSRRYDYSLDDCVYIVIGDNWSRKSISKALTGVSTDISNTINTKFVDYILRLDDDTYVSITDEYDVDDVDILVLRWVYKCIVEHIDFLLK